MLLLLLFCDFYFLKACSSRVAVARRVRERYGRAVGVGPRI